MLWYTRNIACTCIICDGMHIDLSFYTFMHEASVIQNQASWSSAEEEIFILLYSISNGYALRTLAARKTKA